MRRLLSAILICMLLLTCTGCQTQTQQTVFAMDTVMELQLWGRDCKAASDSVIDLIRKLEQSWSPAQYHAVPSKLNRGEEITDPQALALLEKAENLCQRTGGSFDPKLHSTILLWGFLHQDYRVPAPNELAQSLLERKWNMGAILKGYAGQQAIALLSAYHIDRALLNLGGNIQTFGSKSNGTPWQIGIQNPNGGDPIGILSVTGTASIVTSGDYQRYFDRDGVRYHHILDPETGYPVRSGLKSVTVICRDGATADALSTALFVMGLEDGAKHWQESNDFEAVFILENGKIYATEGAQLSGCEFEVISREK